VFGKILQSRIPPPSELRPGLPAALDALVLRGLSRSPAARFASAEEMALALEHAVPPAPPREVSAWLHSLAGEALAKRAALVTEMDGGVSAAIPVAAAAPPAPPAPSVPHHLPSPLVTQRMTVPLRTRPRDAARPHAPDLTALATPPSDVAYLAEAPTVLGQRSSAAPPLSVPAATEPGARRRLVVRAALGAVLLLCSLAAPAFGWMAFTDRDEPPHAATPATLPTVVAAPKETSTTPAKPAKPPRPVAIADEPPAPARSAQPLTPPEPEARALSVSAKSTPAPARVTSKNKAATNTPDYLSSPAFSQRR
jgi:serine/threonine-protein kinase